MIIHNLGTGQAFETGSRDGRLFGSASIPAFAFNPPTPPSAPMPTAAPTTQMGLLGADPSRARADAFLRSLGAMAPGLLMAGAPSTDPGQQAKGLAMAFKAQPQAYQQDLARTRAENVQKMNLQMARAKAAREAALFNMRLDQNAQLQNLLGGGPQPQRQPVQPQAMGNAMNGPEPMVMPKAVQTPQAPTGQTNLMNSMSPEMRASLLAAPLDQRAKLVFDYVKSALNPNTDFNIVSGKLNKQGIMKAEDKLRGELKPIYNKISETNRLAEIAEKGLSSPDGSGHISGLTAMIKMIDPGMVTSGELQLQQSATDALSRAKTIVDNWKEGTVLDPELRAKMVGVVADLKGAVVNAYRPQVRAYKAAADLDQLRWERIWMSDPILNQTQLKAAKPKTAAAPTAPRPASRNNAPPVGSPNSRFNLPNPVTGN